MTCADEWCEKIYFLAELDALDVVATAIGRHDEEVTVDEEFAGGSGFGCFVGIANACGGGVGVVGIEPRQVLSGAERGLVIKRKLGCAVVGEGDVVAAGCGVENLEGSVCLRCQREGMRIGLHSHVCAAGVFVGRGVEELVHIAPVVVLDVVVAIACVLEDEGLLGVAHRDDAVHICDARCQLVFVALLGGYGFGGLESVDGRNHQVGHPGRHRRGSGIVVGRSGLCLQVQRHQIRIVV